MRSIFGVRVTCHIRNRLSNPQRPHELSGRGGRRRNSELQDMQDRKRQDEQDGRFLPKNLDV